MQSLSDGHQSLLGSSWDTAQRANATMVDEAVRPETGLSPLLSMIPPTCEDDLLAAVRPFLAISTQSDALLPARIPVQPRLEEDVPTLARPPTQVLEQHQLQEATQKHGGVSDERFEEPERTVAAAIDIGDASGLQVLETQDSQPLSTGLDRNSKDADAMVMNRAELAADEIRADAGSASPTKAPMQHELISQEEVNVVAPLRLRVRTGQGPTNGSERATTRSPEDGGRGGLDGPSTESTPQVYQGRRSFQLSQSYLPSPVNEPVYPNSAVNGLDATRAQNDPSSSAPHELDADAYVITNYYPSDESQTTSEQGNPNQADNYPLKHRLSQRRGGSLERPAATTFTERPWRHSDSMTPRESRPVQPDGIHAPPVDGRSSWYRANSPTTSPAVARAHRLSLPPTSSRGPSDGERSVSSGNGTMTASSSTRSERAPDQIRHEVDGQPAHPMLESPASSPLAAGRQRPLSYHDGQAAEAERPAVGPRQRSRLFGLRTFLQHHPVESSSGQQVAQAPPLPRRDSRRTRRDGSEPEYHNVPPAHRPRRSSRSQSDEQRAMMSTHSYPSTSSHVAVRNGLSLEESNLYTSRPPSRRPEHPTRPAPVPAPVADPQRHLSSDDSRNSNFPARRRSLSSEHTMSGGLSRERVPGHSPAGGSMPRYGRRDLISPARSYEQARPRAFPSIHEDRVYAEDGPPARTDLAYTPDGYLHHSYSSGSQSQSQQTWPHSSRRTSVHRNPSSQWTGISSAARWSERTTSSNASSQLVKMKTTTIPAALYQQALALKELPPPPPPSKTPAETHPLLEQGLAAKSLGGTPYSTTLV